MKCYQSASAIVRSGTTGFVLVVKVQVYAGFNPPELKKGTPPFDPKNVFPVTIIRAVPSSPTQMELEVTHNLNSEDEFESVELFCDDQKPSTLIPVTKE